jgi:hypothetical protein
MLERSSTHALVKEDGIRREDTYEKADSGRFHTSSLQDSGSIGQSMARLSQQHSIRRRADLPRDQVSWNITAPSVRHPPPYGIRDLRRQSHTSFHGFLPSQRPQTFAFRAEGIIRGQR